MYGQFSLMPASMNGNFRYIAEESGLPELGTTGRTVLVTGGTGFMGKVCCLERAAPLCPAVDRFIVLCRAKLGAKPSRHGINENTKQYR
ncbi:hypothetical protein LSTR_LSTR013395 [Laodelphax striatellus]|uniref:Fatty acyl-CoA reductase n=1 Tax=Laodelphax striatellus TaxID=195883 RepID=A0A482WGZ2_LAOST|nr:hypothetical protein LSTR_LSTR013395 [Laodelphax striatellus]